MYSANLGPIDRSSSIRVPLARVGTPVPLSTVGNSHKVSLVRKFPLFAGISDADCATIVSLAYERQFQRRQAMFFEGDPIKHVLLLVTGCVKVTQFGQNGGEVILRLHGPGEIVGALGLHARTDRTGRAQTLQTSTVLAWEAAKFEALAERFPALWRNSAGIAEQSLQDIEQRYREISTEKVSSRLGSQLARLLSQVGKPVEGHTEVRISRAELAQLTGTTIFTVSRLLSQWEARGIVSARRENVLVTNISALMEVCKAE
jgi:CRP/FNR family transcriptional regulator, nitrogen oxide reductase regulator